MIERQILELQTQRKEDVIPITTTWKDAKMIRTHSFLAAIHEIVKYIEKLDYVKIGIIGDQHSGKTTLAKAIAHVVHKMAEKDLKLTFQVKVFTRQELLNFKETLANLNPANYVMIFDDISFLHEATPKQLAEIKSAVTMIRHMEGGQDVKIVEIDDYHYTKGHDKYLRQSHFKFFTSVGSEETQNVISMTNPKYTNRITKFQVMHSTLLNTGFFKFNLSKKGEPFVYKYRDPFIPCLFWNTSNLRIIVTPTREWMDRACSICAIAEKKKDYDFDMDKFKMQFDDKHGTTAKTAVKMKMALLGMSVYSPNVMRAFYELNRMMQEYNFDIRELAEKYDLKLSKRTCTQDFERLLQNKEEKPKEEKELPPDTQMGKVVEW